MNGTGSENCFRRDQLIGIFQNNQNTQVGCIRKSGFTSERKQNANANEVRGNETNDVDMLLSKAKSIQLRDESSMKS